MVTMVVGAGSGGGDLWYTFADLCDFCVWKSIMCGCDGVGGSLE